MCVTVNTKSYRVINTCEFYFQIFSQKKMLPLLALISPLLAGVSGEEPAAPTWVTAYSVQGKH
jgi:hypothetical protein